MMGDVPCLPFSQDRCTCPLEIWTEGLWGASGDPKIIHTVPNVWKFLIHMYIQIIFASILYKLHLTLKGRFKNSEKNNSSAECIFRWLYF